MGKIDTSLNTRQRHNPLHRDIASVNGNLKSNGHEQLKDNQHHADGCHDASISRKILSLAKSQQEELDAEENDDVSSEEESVGASSERDQYEAFLDDVEDQDLEHDLEVSDIEFSNETDKGLIDAYFAQTETITLADKIMAKIHERELKKEALESEVPESLGVLLPPKVIAAYEKIGRILSTYKHGKLPKLFKVLPTLKNWEDVLFVTNPTSWTPHAVCEATKLFVSNLPSNQAQIFVETVLLPKFRHSIEDSETHTLDYHLYRALKKSLYKPAAFFKGFLLPLVDDQCTLREAMIVASVLSKVSIPALHSSVALTQLTQRNYTPARTVFIRVLIEKRYALPYQTLDDLVFFFMKFRVSSQEESSHETNLPVVWHKAFLAFAQRYKNDITEDQKDFLLETLRQRFHHAIGPEIRRELLSGSGRDDSSVKQAGAMEDAF